MLFNLANRYFGPVHGQINVRAWKQFSKSWRLEFIRIENILSSYLEIRNIQRRVESEKKHFCRKTNKIIFLTFDYCT